MKTKTASSNIKSQHKVLKVSNPPMNSKNNDQLRRKLKELLDKQIISTPKKIGQTISKKINSGDNIKLAQSLVNKKSNKINSKNSKPNDEVKTAKNISNKQTQVIKAKNHKRKAVPSSTCKKDNQKTVIREQNILKKNGKINHGNTLNKKGKQNGTQISGSFPDSNDKTKKIDKPKHAKIEKKKKNKPTFSKINEKIQLKAKSELKLNSDQEKQFPQGQGRLRPKTGELELNADVDFSPTQPKPKNTRRILVNSEIDLSSISKGKLHNTGQALIRANNQLGNSYISNKEDSSDFECLFDETYVDSEDTSWCSSASLSESEEHQSDLSHSIEESDFEYLSDRFDSESSEDYTEEEYFNDYLSDLGSTDDDESYKPSEDIPEDIYIAKGTAVKYDISTDDVGFDSDTDHAQIIEISTKSKASEQENNLSTMKSLPQNLINKNSVKINEEDAQGSDDSCPTLVSIENSQNEIESCDSSSCDLSHSCCSSCDCGDSIEVIDTDSEQQFKPMIPDVIKGEAAKTDEIENFFHAHTSLKKKSAPNSVLEEITRSSNNSLNCKVYSTNNELLNNNSLQIKSSKTGVNKSQSKIGATNNSNPIPREEIVEELETTHVHKKVKKIHDTSLENEMSISKSMPTSGKTSQFNKSNEMNSTRPSQTKPQIQTLFFNAVNCNQVIVLLKDPLYIYGTVKLKLLAGSLEIYGYNPKRNEVLEIFSPRGYSSLKIESLQSVVDVPVNEKEILSLAPFFIRSDLEEVIKKFDSSKDAILMLERNDRSKKVNIIRKYMVEHLFPNMNAIQSDRPFYTSEFLLRCIITPNTDNCLVVNPEWNTISIENNSKIMAIGGKSVGKSTFVRYIINKSLNKYPKILLIDLDIGQPEIFVPQTISAISLTEPLLGPGYFLNKQPDKSFLVGHFNIIHSLEPYLASLRALFEYCNRNNKYENIPWIVNTMGYNKGFGDELISVICSLLQPSNIVQFESDREINDFDVIMIKENVKAIEKNIVANVYETTDNFNPQHQLTLIKSLLPKTRPSKNESTMKPRDMRLAMILSRLSNILVGHAEWMNDVKPLWTSIDDLNIIKMGDDQISKEELVKVLVGNLVYLCRFDSKKAHECFGIGIVRGVDYPLRQIYLLPSISADLLKNVNCLAICGIPLPSSILLKQGPKVKGTASYVYNTLDEAASMYVQQIFNKPQQFPTGKRKVI